MTREHFLISDGRLSTRRFCYVCEVTNENEPLYTYDFAKWMCKKHKIKDIGR